MRRSRPVYATLAVTSAWLGWRGLRTPPPRPTPAPIASRAGEEDAGAGPQVDRAALARALRARHAAAMASPAVERSNAEHAEDLRDLAPPAPLSAAERRALGLRALEDRLRKLEVYRDGLVASAEPPPPWFDDEVRALETRYFTTTAQPQGRE